MLGGDIERKCNVCKLNNQHLYFNCPYINNLKIDESVYYDIAEFEDLDLIFYECPRFYYIENQFLYSTIFQYSKREYQFYSEYFYLRTAIFYQSIYIALKSKK